MHRQKHRGTHPKDEELFAPEIWKSLGLAILDLYFLYSRRYSESTALRVVGDHFQLHKRQRFALQRIVSNQRDILELSRLEVDATDIRNKPVAIDGFNLLIFTEVLLSNGYIFQCLDRTYRDIASIHGSYHQIIETGEAIRQLGRTLHQLKPASVKWFLDQPVSNSGKLKKFLHAISEEEQFNWDIEIVPNADQALLALPEAVLISNDRRVLSKSRQWFNFSKLLARHLGEKNAHLISLADLGINDLQLEKINSFLPPL